MHCQPFDCDLGLGQLKPLELPRSSDQPRRSPVCVFYETIGIPYCSGLLLLALIEIELWPFAFFGCGTPRLLAARSIVSMYSPELAFFYSTPQLS